MGKKFRDRSNEISNALQQMKGERLLPNHGVDVEPRSFEDLGETAGSKALKDLIRSMAERKLQQKGGG